MYTFTHIINFLNVHYIDTYKSYKYYYIILYYYTYIIIFLKKNFKKRKEVKWQPNCFIFKLFFSSLFFSILFHHLSRLSLFFTISPSPIYLTFRPPLFHLFWSPAPPPKLSPHFFPANDHHILALSAIVLQPKPWPKPCVFLFQSAASFGFCHNWLFNLSPKLFSFGIQLRTWENHCRWTTYLLANRKLLASLLLEKACSSFLPLIIRHAWAPN